jgi:DNA-binding transcriptional MocR family regulator
MATFIDQLLSEGVVQTHIASLLQPSYRARYQTVVNAIHEHLIPLGFTMPSVSLPIVGGYFVWIDLPDSLQASTLTDKALVEESLKIGSGTLFQVQGDTAEDRDDFEGSIRICFAWEEFNLLEPGVRRLADVARRMLTGR